ncbi:class I SAM-dependent methyltransferase [Archangium sp.]|uniref:class I SAM-dependent methyltransferase n=1 Tax=Archangium sp. TaxID=1872627 RepID=UPI00389AA0BB
MDDNLGFYERAELYDIAFSFRDIGGEVDVLTGWYRSMTGRPGPARVLELGAGPAQHAREFVRRGAEGWALDMSAAMADYARARAAADGVRIEVVMGDMTAFELARRFDLMLLMINSVGHLMTDALLVRHLECVARALTPGGIYVMEVAHPADDANHPEGEPPRQWSAQRGQTTVDIRWGRLEDPLDREHRIRTHTVELNANIAGRPVSFVEQVRLRAWKRQAIDEAIQRVGGFSTVRVYGDFSPDVPLEHSAAWRMIYVMQRADSPRR